MLENFRRNFSPGPTDCPWVSEDACLVKTTVDTILPGCHCTKSIEIYCWKRLKIWFNLWTMKPRTFSHRKKYLFTLHIFSVIRAPAPLLKLAVLRRPGAPGAQTRTQSLFMCFWGGGKIGVRLRRAGTHGKRQRRAIFPCLGTRISGPPWNIKIRRQSFGWISGSIGHFRVSPGLCFKTRVVAQPLIRKSFFILMQVKLIFTRKVVHLASFWKWGFLELVSGLFTAHSTLILFQLCRYSEFLTQ